MTQHIFQATTKNGQMVEVFTGWDRPLQGFFMVIENIGEETDDDEGGVIFDNMMHRPAHPNTFDDFAAILQGFGIRVPDGLVEELQADQSNNLGNKRKDWGSSINEEQDSRECQRP